MHARNQGGGKWQLNAVHSCVSCATGGMDHCNFVKFKSSNYTDFPQEAMRASKDGNHISESFSQSIT